MTDPGLRIWPLPASRWQFFQAVGFVLSLAINLVIYNPELGDGQGFLFAQMRDRLGGCWILVPKGQAQRHFRALQTDDSLSRGQFARFWRLKCLLDSM